MCKYLIYSAFAFNALISSSSFAKNQEDDQEILARHSINNSIVLLNGANDGAWLMERPVSGILRAQDCLTDFSAPTSTRLKSVSNPANHLSVNWAEVGNVRLLDSGIQFDAPWVGFGNFAILKIADSNVRYKLYNSIRNLVDICHLPTLAEAIGARPQNSESAEKIIRVTSEMVEHDEDDIIKRYFFTYKIPAKKGDTFTISWRGDYRVALDHLTDEDMVIHEPTTQSVYDLAKSATVKMNSDGIYNLLFWEEGIASGGVPRQFTPFTISVRKTN